MNISCHVQNPIVAPFGRYEEPLYGGPLYMFSTHATAGRITSPDGPPPDVPHDTPVMFSIVSPFSATNQNE